MSTIYLLCTLKMQRGEKILHLDLLKKQKLQKSCSLCAVFLSLLHL